MDAMNNIFERRSVRDFLDRPVPKDEVELLVHAASYAPSAHNGQPWEFIYVDEREVLDSLNEGRKYTRMLLHAPGAFVVCAKCPPEKRKKAVQGDIMHYIQDTAAAIQNLLLAAHARGLGSCWIGDFDERFLRDTFEIPEDYVPVAIVAIGYPKYMPNARPRRSVAEILHWGRF